MLSGSTYMVLYVAVLATVALVFYCIFEKFSSRMPREIKENKIMMACISAVLTASPVVNGIAYFTGMLGGSV